jgi:acetyl/propionyl-CoA carboxylase alpha subunit
VITKLLIANRGEIARRIIRTCKARGIATVAVFSDPDATAPFVREADESVALGGRSPAESYLRHEAIVAAAAMTGADAVHPGYGFLAENATFARACQEAGLTFLGPSPEVIDAMGSKIKAREIMDQAGVPLAPALTVTPSLMEAPGELIAQIGLPLIVKASAGGGGKGMRIVRDPAAFTEAYRLARDEARAAFGDDSVFVERYVEGARHVEVQIIGDMHGEVRDLFERDCSIQRRHQKIIEEAPAPGLSPEVRQRFADIAVAAGRQLGYVGVGTVEFLYDESSQDIYFLEINTRLQVEHPVTEAVTGLDLVAAQIDVAEGLSLDQAIGQPQVRGHAIEARIYAEDPAQGFLPATGRLSSFAFDEQHRLRVDAGPEPGDHITADYDPMIAKVIAHAPTRAGAARLLAAGLRAARIHGLQTNRDFLVRLLEDEAFQTARLSTQYLESDSAAALTRPLIERPAPGMLLAAALAAQARQRAGARCGTTLPSGWRNVGSGEQRRVFACDDEEIVVRYDLPRGRFWVGDQELGRVLVHDATAELVDLQLDGSRQQYAITCSDNDLVFVNTPAGQLEMREVARFGQAAQHHVPGSLAAPLPGKVVSVMCAHGQAVDAGDVLLVIEAMKMQHEVCAVETGTIDAIHVDEGDHVEAGALIAVIATQEEAAG